MRAGESLAVKKVHRHPRFTVSMNGAERCSLLLAVGSAQFPFYPDHSIPALSEIYLR